MRGVVFWMGGCPMGGISFDGDVFKKRMALGLPPSGFFTGIGNMGDSSTLDGEDLSQYMGRAWGDLKCCQKIPEELI